VRALVTAVIAVSGVVIVVLGGWWLLKSDDAPETPANAVLSFGSHVALREYDDAWGRLCAELKADALRGQGEQFHKLQDFLQFEENLSTKPPISVDANRALVPLSVTPKGAVDSRTDEDWVATMVNEDGRWRVCGYERAK
jgi:hypothetical protein